MGTRTVITSLVLASLSSAGAAAQNLAVSGHVGTLGLGADVSIGIAPRLGVRAGVNVQPWKPTQELDQIDFELNLPSPSFTGTLDVYLAGPFRLSGGLVALGSDIEVTGDLTADVEIGDETYSPSEIGTLSGVFDTRNVAPWFGLGLGKASGRGVGFTLDLGVALVGAPDVRLNATGPLSNEPAFQSNLRMEEQNIQDDADVVKLYPIISLGIVVGF